MKTNPILPINFNKWTLVLKNSETGRIEEPVKPSDFSHYEYWNVSGQPIRQIITKNGRGNYGDFLAKENGTLRRTLIQKWLGVSPYDDEITEEDYYELCQTCLFQHHFYRLINYSIIVPFQSLALSYYQVDELPILSETRSFYEIDVKSKSLVKTKVYEQNLQEITEYEYYRIAIGLLVDTYGQNILKETLNT